MGIIIAFTVMLSVALVAGILLSLFSHFFSVKQDPLKTKLRECLPGINCGACGYKGCDDYADALRSGEVDITLCIPGGQKTADKISEVLHIEAEPFRSIVAFVKCNGTCEATFKKCEYEGVYTCKAASMIYGGDNSCRYGCLGYGDCAAACPTDAICMDDGIAHVDTRLCIGCGLCTDTCPKDIIYMMPLTAGTVVMCSNMQVGAEARKACKNACIACRRCVKACPNDAITVENNLAVIDYDKCINCGECITVCPTGCIKSVSFSKPSLNIEHERIIDRHE